MVGDEGVLESTMELTATTSHRVPLSKLKAWLESSGRDPREAADEGEAEVNLFPLPLWGNTTASQLGRQGLLQSNSRGRFMSRNASDSRGLSRFDRRTLLRYDCDREDADPAYGLIVGAPNLKKYIRGC